MANEFTGKRFTTQVNIRKVYDCITMRNYEYPPEYFVYDKKTQSIVNLPDFKPCRYEDIRQKAHELNEMETEEFIEI